MILDRISGGGLVFVGDLTLPGEGWPPENDPGGAKSALYAGNVVAVDPMSDAVPPPGDVQWENGTSLQVPMISAAQALDELRREATGKCQGCTPMTLDDATLTTASFQTSRGPAVVPAWSFHIQGSHTSVIRIAIGAEQRTMTDQSKGLPDDERLVAVDSARGDSASTGLTLHFVGAKEGADQVCGEDYGGAVVETDNAVVAFIVRVREYTPPSPGEEVICELVGYDRTLTLEIAAPLGDRVVLDAREGIPVPVISH